MFSGGREMKISKISPFLLRLPTRKVWKSMKSMELFMQQLEVLFLIKPSRIHVCHMCYKPLHLYRYKHRYF